MTVRLVGLSIDAVDPSAEAAFWAGALGWAVADEDGDVALVATDGTGIRLRFVAVAGPKVAKNAIHLDLTTTSVDDRDGLVARLLALGARHADVGQGPEETHVVLADPEGNELCVIEPGNRFLAGAPRVGAINCVGTATVGRFWSAALGWPLVWDQDGETAIAVPDRSRPLVTWSPPRPGDADGDRVRLDVAVDGEAGIERLVTLGATRLDAGALADPDGRRFGAYTTPPRILEAGW